MPEVWGLFSTWPGCKAVAGSEAYADSRLERRIRRADCTDDKGCRRGMRGHAEDMEESACLGGSIA